MLNRLILFFICVLVLNIGIGSIGMTQTDSAAPFPDPAGERASGITTVPGNETGVFVQEQGRDWRRLRNDWIVPIGGWGMLAVLAGIAVFYLWRGKVRLENGRSGRRMPRWSGFERLLHWVNALLFIVMALTGLSLLLGRALLIPLIGPQAFSAYAQYAMWTHNVTGPVFALTLLVILFMWFRDNLWHKVDWHWFKQGGGIVFKDKHPAAERMNGGEKPWYWLLVLAGVLVVISGLIMDFPIFGQDRWAMQSSQIIHATLAVALIAMFFGHVYIGTIGMEGSFESMTRGTVDYNWAEQHHRIWYQRKLRGAAPEDDRELQAKPLAGQRLAQQGGDD